jgi:GAF domain-containing protein
MAASSGLSGGLERLADAFAELVETTVGEFDVHVLLQGLVDRCVDVLDVAAAGLMLADGSSDLQVMVATSERAKLLELFQIQHDEGPCLDSYRTGEVVVEEVLDGRNERWPRFAAAAEGAGFTSVFAVPMQVDGRVVGGLNLFGTSEQPGPTMTTARVAQAMAKVAAVAIEKDQVSRDRATLIVQLETALESRVAIEQAKGILSSRLDIDLNDAFVLLRQRARNARRLLRDVAAEVVATKGNDYSANDA